MGVYITFERIFTQKARHNDLVNYISEFPKVGFVEMACGVAAILHNTRQQTPFAFQRNFANEFRDGVPFMGRVIEILDQEPNSILVHDEQLAVLLKFALLYADATGWPKGHAADLLIRLMLVYNSLHGGENEPGSGERDTFMRFELRSVFNFVEHLGYVIHRYGSFFEWARNSPEAKASENYLDLDADFHGFYGMTYEEWAASAFAILSYFRKITGVQVMEQIKPVMDVAKYTAAIASDAPIHKWVELNTVQLDEAISFFERTKDSPLYSGMSLLPFMRRPLLQVAEGRVCAPYLPYLENSLGSGLFFAFLDGYNKHDGRAASDMFTRFFGEFFEDYIVSLFRKDHPTPDRVFGEIVYAKGKKSTDLVIFEGDAAIFIDITSSRFNFIKTLLNLDSAGIIKDMEKIVVDNAEQLDKSIKAFKEGRLVYTGVSVAEVKRIYPVVLSIQLLPRAFEFNRRIFAEVERRGFLNDVERLEVLTAEDAEGIGALYRGGVLLSDILARKAVHQHPKARNDSLKNYLYYFEEKTLRQAVEEKASPESDPWFQRILGLVGQWMNVQG